MSVWPQLSELKSIAHLKCFFGLNVIGFDDLPGWREFEIKKWRIWLTEQSFIVISYIVIFEEDNHWLQVWESTYRWRCSRLENLVVAMTVWTYGFGVI